MTKTTNHYKVVIRLRSGIDLFLYRKSELHIGDYFARTKKAAIDYYGTNLLYFDVFQYCMYSPELRRISGLDEAVEMHKMWTAGKNGDEEAKKRYRELYFKLKPDHTVWPYGPDV